MKKFDSYREDNRREVKRATDKLPNSVWKLILLSQIAEVGLSFWELLKLKTEDGTLQG